MPRSTYWGWNFLFRAKFKNNNFHLEIFKIFFQFKKKNKKLYKFIEITALPPSLAQKEYSRHSPLSKALRESLAESYFYLQEVDFIMWDIRLIIIQHFLSFFLLSRFENCLSLRVSMLVKILRVSDLRRFFFCGQA